MSEPLPTHPSDAVRLVLVDDHRFVRNGLRSMLESGGHVVVGEAATAREGLRVACDELPDVVMLDIGLPDMSGLDVIAQLREQVPGASVVMMTASAEQSDMVRAIRQGAVSYLLKDASPEEVLATVKAVADGQALLPPQVVRGLVEHLRREEAPVVVPPPPRIPMLSDRERHVLRLIAAGQGNTEIADEMMLSVGTVKSDVSSILLKLDVENRVQAAVAAWRLGLLV